MDDSVLFEFAMDVIALISPNLPVSVSRSSLAGSVIEKCREPSCAKISCSFSSINLAFNA